LQSTLTISALAGAGAPSLTEKRIDEGCIAYEDDSKGFSEAEKCALRYADLMFLCRIAG
jgi:hypothetical protein